MWLSGQGCREPDAGPGTAGRGASLGGRWEPLCPIESGGRLPLSGSGSALLWPFLSPAEGKSPAGAAFPAATHHPHPLWLDARVPGGYPQTTFGVPGPGAALDF